VALQSVLTGSIRKTGDQLLISVELFNQAIEGCYAARRLLPAAPERFAVDNPGSPAYHEIGMSPGEESQITVILREVSEGREGAAGRLFSLVYDELHAIARRRLLQERKDHTLGATDLVHEAYLSLARHLDDRDWRNRGHFYRAAAEAMRHILVDHARRRGRVKRGGGARREALNVAELAVSGDGAEILAVDEAIQRLEAKDPPLAEIVRLRFYAGLSVDETAAAVGSSPRTIARQWTFARAWLHGALEGIDS